MKFQTLTYLFITLCVGSAAFADHHEGKKHEDGFVSLFDGKSLKNWDGNPKFWSVTDGAISGTTTKENPTKGNTFLIWRGGKVDDFELRLKFKIIGGNSGIQYRSEDKGNWVVGGYQADFEAGTTYSGILYEERGRGILAQRGQVTQVFPGDKPKIEVLATIGESSDINKVIKPEDWNDYKIIARGNRLMHVINGRMTCLVEDHDKTKGAKSGILALQLHAGPPMNVQFKDIRIKPLNGRSVAGNWNFEVETVGAGGRVGEPKFTFDVADGKLKGHYSGLLGEIDNVTGKVDGDTISWTVSGSYNDQDISAQYEGTITGLNEMSGTVTFNEQFDATWKAKRSN